MAKRDKYTAPRNPQSRTGVEDPQTAEQTLKGIEKWYEKNKNIINGIGMGILVLFAGMYAYNRFLKAPKESKADDAIFTAQKYFERDSTTQVLNGDGNNFGVLKVLDKYGGSSAGNLAQYYAGVSYLKNGEFDKAIKHLKKFDGHGTIPGLIAKGALGDAYMEKGKKEEALKYYLEAGADEDNNLVSPIYLERAALVYELSGNNDQAIATFERIKSSFPDSKQSQNADKYLARLGKF